MYKLESKPRLGTLKYYSSTDTWEYDVGTAHFSTIQKDEYYLICFWAKVQYDFFSKEENKTFLVDFTIVQVLTKVDFSFSDLSHFEINLPEEFEVQDEWGASYYYNHYEHIHQGLKNVILLGNKLHDGTYEVRLTADLQEFVSQRIDCFCTLSLENGINRFW